MANRRIEDGMNLYEYAGGRPIVALDPLGEAWDDVLPGPNHLGPQPDAPWRTVHGDLKLNMEGVIGDPGRQIRQDYETEWVPDPANKEVRREIWNVLKDKDYCICYGKPYFSIRFRVKVADNNGLDLIDVKPIGEPVLVDTESLATVWNHTYFSQVKAANGNEYVRRRSKHVLKKAWYTRRYEGTVTFWEDTIADCPEGALPDNLVREEVVSKGKFTKKRKVEAEYDVVEEQTLTQDQWDAYIKAFVAWVKAGSPDLSPTAR